MTDRPGAVAPRPVLATSVAPRRSSWLVLPGWGQSGHHWVALARWLSRSKVDLDWLDLAAVAAVADGERGTARRLLSVADTVRRALTGRAYGGLVAHSAAAAVAVLAADRGAEAAWLALIEPIPAQFGVGPARSGPGPTESGPRPDESEPVAVQPLRALYPLASDEVIRQIAAASGSDLGLALTAPGRAPVQPDEDRAAQVSTAWRRLTVPARVVCGSLSSVCPEHLARTMVSSCPTARPVVRLDRSGHSPHIDRPDALAAVLLDPAA